MCSNVTIKIRTTETPGFCHTPMVMLRQRKEIKMSNIEAVQQAMNAYDLDTRRRFTDFLLGSLTNFVSEEDMERAIKVAQDCVDTYVI